MQLNLAGLVLATLTICNRSVQVANLIGFEAVNFVPGAEVHLIVDKVCFGLDADVENA